MIEIVVIVAFLYSIGLFLGVCKIYDLDQEQKRLKKEILRRKFQICHNKGIRKGIKLTINNINECIEKCRNDKLVQ